MTLVEVVTALAILAITMAGILAVQMQSRRLTEGSVYQNTAITIVQGYLEQMKNMDLPTLLGYDPATQSAPTPASRAIPTKYSDTVDDNIYTSVSAIPSLSTLTPGTTPSGIVDNLKAFDMIKDITIGSTASGTSTDTTYHAVTQQVAWTTLWPGALSYSNAISSGFSVGSTTTGISDLHLNLWVWITDLSGTATYANKVYGITIIYTWQFLDGNRPRYAMGTVRSIRSSVPSY